MILLLLRAPFFRFFSICSTSSSLFFASLTSLAFPSIPISLLAPHPFTHKCSWRSSSPSRSTRPCSRSLPSATSPRPRSPSRRPPTPSPGCSSARARAACFEIALNRKKFHSFGPLPCETPSLLHLSSLSSLRHGELRVSGASVKEEKAERARTGREL